MNREAPQEGTEPDGHTEPENDRGLRGGTLHRHMPSLDQVRSVLQKHFSAYEERRDAGPFGDVYTFHVNHEKDLSKRFEALHDGLRELDPRLMAILRQERGEDIIRITPRPRAAPERTGLPATLFALTVATTVLSGSFAWTSYHGEPDLLAIFRPDALLMGSLAFALPLLAVLLLHEAAHHWVARRHRVQVSRPYFIPVPPIVFFPSLGTFGSVRSVWDPMPSRKALFDVGVVGPLVAFLAALPLVAGGLALTAVDAVPVPHDENLEFAVVLPDNTTVGDGGKQNPAVYATQETDDGFLKRITINITGRDHGGNLYRVELRLAEGARSIAYNLSVAWPGADITPRLDEGNLSGGQTHTVNASRPDTADQLVATLRWDRVEQNTVSLGEPLAFLAISRLMGTQGNFLIHPTAFAGWVALLVTSIQLLPAGQLDGGHIARSVLGNRMRWASYVAIGGLMIAAFAFVGWIYLVLLIVLFTGIHHPAPLDDHTPLDPKRKALAALAVVVFVLSFVPVPVSGL